MTGCFEVSWADVVVSLSLVGVLLVVGLVERLGIGRSVGACMTRTFVQLMVFG